ncbi:helix-turn-helix domain-containing protein [Bulleidia sp. zg-1006]|uniref:helix-turn-helix domain-containing protein n=1 Tax=unclassified Bulleidia TaxID=2704656 RepID=UPI0019398942|nr:cupin domain-containing protein [Trueperella sp. zg.1013]QRG87484.1 cupin domain-containing protein [Bulleidia sp. zg-1006]
MDIGARIKQLRLKNDLTLEELASRTELTKGFLSQLERNLTSPSIQSLADVAEALGVNLSGFFQEDVEEQIVFQAEDAFVDEQEGVKTFWIVPNAQKNRMEPIRLVIEPNHQSKVLEPHEGEEFGYVLSGRVHVVTQSHPKGYVVRKGDSFYLTGKEIHWIENRAKKMAELLWVSTPPKF